MTLLKLFAINLFLFSLHHSIQSKNLWISKSNSPTLLYIVKKNSNQIYNNDTSWGCIDSIIKTIKSSSKIQLKEVKEIHLFYNSKKKDSLSITINSQFLKLMWNGSEKIFLNESYSEWIKFIDSDNIKGYVFNCKHKEYCILTAFAKDATGLMTNFTQFLIIEFETNKCWWQKGLAEYPVVFFQGSNIFFVFVNFGESFIHKKDFDNIDYRIGLYKLSKGNLIFVDEKQNIKCK